MFYVWRLRGAPPPIDRLGAVPHRFFTIYRKLTSLCVLYLTYQPPATHLTNVSTSQHTIRMNNDVSPTRAYDLLDAIEREIVDGYVAHVKADQKFRGERIAVALSYPIPAEHVRRSKGALNKPIVRIAVQERIQAIANDEDLSPDRVIKEHAAIAFSSLKNFVEPADFGEFRVKSLDEIPDELMGAVKTIRTVPTAYGNRIEVILHDKIQSLKAMGELMGLVAPDKPPALTNYVAPKEEKKQLSNTPGEIYSNMLETMA